MFFDVISSDFDRKSVFKKEKQLLIWIDYPQKKNDSLTEEIVFDIVYYIFPPVATGLETSRKSTWVRPIIDGQDYTAIQGYHFLRFVFVLFKSSFVFI